MELVNHTATVTLKHHIQELRRNLKLHKEKVRAGESQLAKHKETVCTLIQSIADHTKALDAIKEQD